MARTEITLQTITVSGIVETFVSAITDGHSAKFNGRDLILHFKNVDVSSRTITIQAPGSYDGVALTAPTVVIPANTGDKVVKVMCSKAFTQSDGMVYWDYSAISGVTVSVLQM